MAICFGALDLIIQNTHTHAHIPQINHHYLFAVPFWMSIGFNFLFKLTAFFRCFFARSVNFGFCAIKIENGRENTDKQYNNLYHYWTRGTDISLSVIDIDIVIA